MSSLYKQRCSELVKLGDYNILNDYKFFKDIMTQSEFENEIRLKQNRKNKRNRCWKMIQELLRCRAYIPQNTNVLFITLTLNDKEIKNKKTTIDKKINKYLKKMSIYSIINEDYGDKTNRLHYHAIILSDKKIIQSEKKSRKGHKLYNFKDDIYEMGFSPDIEIINLEDAKKVRNYLLKLNNHTNKNTTGGRVRVIKNTTGIVASLSYPRTKKEWLKYYNFKNKIK